MWRLIVVLYISRKLYLDMLDSEMVVTDENVFLKEPDTQATIVVSIVLVTIFALNMGVGQRIFYLL